jgi:ribonuclease HI
MSNFDYTLGTYEDSEDTVMLQKGEINVYSDASLDPKNRKAGTGGGGVIIVPEILAGKDSVVKFSAKFDEITDINVAEAKMACILMKWVCVNYPNTTVNIYLDSLSVIQRSGDMIIDGKPMLCDCCDEGIQFIPNRSGNFCKRCGGHIDKGGVSYEIQSQVLKFVNILEKYEGVVNISHVKAHKNNWGNNMADLLAKKGRRNAENLEIEFTC